MCSISKSIGILTAAAFLLLGCSSTQLTCHTRGMEPPWCKNGLHGSTVAVYWDTAWRRDQKEIERRETLFAKEIGVFFGTNECVKTVRIARSIGNKPISMCTDAEIASDARASGADKAIVMRLEELGPNLMLYLSPILWQTQNEVLLRTKVLDSRDGSIVTDTVSHWYRGGPFLLLGTRSLHKDIDGTLEALFLGGGK